MKLTTEIAENTEKNHEKLRDLRDLRGSINL